MDLILFGPTKGGLVLGFLLSSDGVRLGFLRFCLLLSGGLQFKRSPRTQPRLFLADLTAGTMRLGATMVGVSLPSSLACRSLVI